MTSNAQNSIEHYYEYNKTNEDIENGSIKCIYILNDLGNYK